MYLRILLFISKIRGYRPSSARRAILEVLSFICKLRLQNCKWPFPIGVVPQYLKSDLIKRPQTSLLKVKIGEIIVSTILQARDGFKLLKSRCRLKLNRAWTAFSLKRSSDRVKFPVEECTYTKAYIRRYRCSSHFSVHVSAFTGISSVVSITGYPLISWTREVLSTSWSRHIQGPCCYETMHVFASKTTSAESLFNLGISFKSRRFGKILKTLQQDKTKIWSLDLLFNFQNSCVSIAGPQKRNRDRPLVGFNFAQNKTIPFSSKKWHLMTVFFLDVMGHLTRGDDYCRLGILLAHNTIKRNSSLA